uniref:Mediator complex subunit 16 n=1 Tax=Mycena chlorophos TaxID=658473 RepID=A0ABQ0LQ49_MYCCL|nr:predicted protein [Mycena chlorophos]
MQTREPDFQSLLDTPRPVVWASTSVLFYAHSTQPIVAARHLFSTKQFALQSPTPIASAPASYSPPTVISASATAEWLYAYFPSSEGDADGVGCLWIRAPPIDTWIVRQFWSHPAGTGVVAAAWLGSPREWSLDDSGVPTRLSPRGPPTPLTNPTFVLVTEDRRVAVHYQPQYAQGQAPIKIASCSLTGPSNSGADSNATASANIKICFRAAVGLAYNESTIIIATRSKTLASEPRIISQEAPIDLTMELDLPPPPPQPEHLLDWGCWGEDEYIELCEVHMNTAFSGIVLSTSPLPPLHGSNASLSRMLLAPVLPGSEDLNAMYLTATFLDFSDYSSNPTSEMVLYGLSRDNKNGNAWICRQASTRSFDGSVAVYVTCGAASSPGLVVGLITSTGSSRQSTSKKQIQTGSIRVLRLPSLADDELWGTVRIMSPAEHAGQDMPLDAVFSQNNAMILSSTPSSFGTPPVTLHASPRPAQSANVAPSAPQLAVAILSGGSTADLSHLLAHPTISAAQVGETLYEAIKIVSRSRETSRLTLRSLGVVLETYRLRSKRSSSLQEREDFESRWQAAFDICSIVSCNSAFTDCQQGEAFDLAAVWQLVALCTWVVSFGEKLLRECVLVINATKVGQMNDPPNVATPIMLHISHPFALKNLHAAVGHVNKFKNKIMSLNASEENSHLAKSVLLDLIQCSGVDLRALESLLSELLVEANKFSVEDAQRSLSLCEPMPAMVPHITTAIERLTQGAVIDRPRLFIKPNELVDGVSMQDGRKDVKRDLVSKSRGRARWSASDAYVY